MRKRLFVLICVFSLVGVMDVAAGASTVKTTEATPVAGGWQATPSFTVPTGGDPAACQLSYQALATFNGAFNGVWHEVSMTATCDKSKLPDSLPYRAAGSGTFDGVYFGDKSRGSFSWSGAWTGDAISGQATGVFDITSSSGDPTWRCSSLHLTFDGYVSFATSFGGYRGIWYHGCKS